MTINDTTNSAVAPGSILVIVIAVCCGDNGLSVKFFLGKSLEKK